MLRFARPLAFVTLIAVLVSCAPAANTPIPSVPGPDAVTPSGMATADASTMPATTAPSAGASATATTAPGTVTGTGFSGMASLRGTAFGGAEVVVVDAGTRAVLGKGTTDAQGRYAIIPSAAVASGALVQVIVTKGSDRLTTMARFSADVAAYSLAALGSDGDVTAETTLAVAAMFDALVAADKAVKAGDANTEEKARKAFEAYVEVRELAKRTLPAANTGNDTFIAQLFDGAGAPINNGAARSGDFRTFLNTLSSKARELANALSLSVDTAPFESRSSGGGNNKSNLPGTGITVNLASPSPGQLIQPSGGPKVENEPI